MSVRYFPEWCKKMDPKTRECIQWERWTKRGEVVSFPTEQEAREYLRGIVLVTRIKKEEN